LGPGKGPDPIAVHQKCPARALYIIIWHDFFYIYTYMYDFIGETLHAQTKTDSNLILSGVVVAQMGRALMGFKKF
jgi:hypothetical protein